ncbi:hypothetical protein HS99_0016180 [Kitasatospora aureofaciens]|uniref:Uncharacterized protein n=1 Tax=Kitasatospora aureofaciens TaxID=1894 RepID=A0A1E7MUZ9_KITAU|nr:hypothetical protein [Kitasatospora aureofaciens]OEV32256.1 hypothetical protein HS99_0016180 [Kitasatospora aureofaciens]
MTSTDLNRPDTRRAFRTVRRLVLAYLGVSALTLVAAFALRDHTDLITPAVWVRGTIVLAGAAVALLLTVRAARGSRGAFRRLRVVSGAMLVAIAAIIAVPGVFPVWMKIEQGFCGLALLGVAVVLNGRQLRALFARP